MTAIAQTTGAAASAAPAAKTTGGAATVNYDAFLKLLVAQAKNQDPTNPTDSTQYLSQLAAFSSVEQTIQTNSKLDQLIASVSLTQANSLLGLHVASLDGATAGTVESVAFANGAAVATLDTGASLVIDNTVSVSRA
jgi:flagellar basal-body rod modification protein FlgD